MRKHSIVAITFIGFLLSTAGAIAQISLSINNTPKPEYQYNFERINFNYTDLFHAGTDTVWDLSDAIYTGVMTTFYYTQDTAFDPFPNCAMTNELYYQLNNLDNSFIQGNGIVYQKTDTAILVAYEKNTNQYTTCFVLNNHYYPVMTFPFEYGTVLHKPSNMYVNHVFWEKEGDAWGTLICPDTTYNNVLRVVTVDSLSYIPSTSPSSVNAKYTSFQWFTLESEMPVLSIQVTHYVYWHHFYGETVIIDTTALLYQSKIYLPLDTPFHGQVAYNDVVVYPNPAINSISIEGSDSISEVIIHNTFGQAVLRFTEFIAVKHVTIDISNLRKGVYVVSGKFSTSGKFRKRIVVTKE